MVAELGGLAACEALERAALVGVGVGSGRSMRAFAEGFLGGKGWSGGTFRAGVSGVVAVGMAG